MQNDSGFLTQHQSLSGYAKTADHYTKTESDNKYQPKGNYLTSVPSEYVTETELNAKGFLTQHQDLSAYAKKATTLEGYGITDAAKKEEVEQLSELLKGFTNTSSADYAQNDPNASDYIKNRPFYKSGEVVRDQEVITKLSEKGTILGGSAVSAFIDETGVSYNVTVDGVLYELTSKEFVDNDGVTQRYVGNFMACRPSLLGYTDEELQRNGVEDTGESFCVVTATVLSSVYTMEAGTYHIKIEKITEFKQIDEEFIPEGIARIEDVEKISQQILDLKYTDTIVYDGHPIDTVIISAINEDYSYNYNYNLVSENVISLDDLSNGVNVEVAFTNGDEPYKYSLNDFQNYSDKIITSQSDSGMFFVTEDNAVLSGTTISKKGVYVRCDDDRYVSKVTILGYKGFAVDVATKQEVGALEKYVDNLCNSLYKTVSQGFNDINDDFVEMEAKIPVVDSAWNKDSTNPIQGKVLYETFDMFNNNMNQLSEQIADQQTLEKNPLWGKKVSFLGDSICAGADTDVSYLGGYGKIIADRNNMVYENLGKGGATITAETYSVSNGGVAKGWLCRMVDNMSADADYAIVEGGVNDAWQWIDHGTIEIGEISNGYNATLDDTTYYGAFESMLKKLITKFQGKKIGYIAIPKIMELYDSSRNVPNFYHIALECCAKWGVPVCDLNTITPPSTCLGTTYVPDGTHPNYEGYLKYYCDPIESWMKTLTTGGNNNASVALQAVKDYTKGFNDAIKALQDGKLDNTGISFRKALLPLADGTTIEIDVLTALDGTVVIKYVNRVPISIDTDGSVFNGTGYKDNLRLSSSGVIKNCENSYVTGFIPTKGGDVIRIFRCDWATLKSAMNYVCAYDRNFNFIGGYATTGGVTTLTFTKYGTDIISSYSSDENMNFTMTLASLSNIAYIRVSSAGDAPAVTCTFDITDMVVTVNEEITD